MLTSVLSLDSLHLLLCTYPNLSFHKLPPSQRPATQRTAVQPAGGFAACLAVQDDLNNDTDFEFEPRLAGSGASRG